MSSRVTSETCKALSHTHAHTCPHTHTRMSTHIHTLTLTEYTHVHPHDTRTHKHIIHALTCAYPHPLSRTFTHIHMHAHTLTCVHTLTHMAMRKGPGQSCLWSPAAWASGRGVQCPDLGWLLLCPRSVGGQRAALGPNTDLQRARGAAHLAGPWVTGVQAPPLQLRPGAPARQE